VEKLMQKDIIRDYHINLHETIAIYNEKFREKYKDIGTIGIVDSLVLSEIEIDGQKIFCSFTTVTSAPTSEYADIYATKIAEEMCEKYLRTKEEC